MLERHSPMNIQLEKCLRLRNDRGSNPSTLTSKVRPQPWPSIPGEIWLWPIHTRAKKSRSKVTRFKT